MTITNDRLIEPTLGAFWRRVETEGLTPRRVEKLTLIEGALRA
jgi:hypothetical protein